MNSYLIVHHPYRTLQDLTPVIGLTPEEGISSWSVINDSYLTDLPMLYPPHIIALTAIFLSAVLKSTHSGQVNLHGATVSAVPAAVAAVVASGGTTGGSSAPQSRINKLIEWYAESGVDMEAIIDCTQEIISLYEVWDTFVDKVCKEQLSRMIKQRGLT